MNPTNLEYICKEDALAVVRFSKDPVNGIENLSALDVVPVVRCKDCKHWHEFGEFYDCKLVRGLTDTSQNDYCSYGERRDNE